MKTNRIVRAWIWLRRIGHCRGFGIQSPWAYSLVRYVINEHFPYYAYADLDAGFPGADAVRRKTGRFFLRLANYVQPATVVSITAVLFVTSALETVLSLSSSMMPHSSVNAPRVPEPSSRVITEIAPEAPPPQPVRLLAIMPNAATAAAIFVIFFITHNSISGHASLCPLPILP